MNIRQLKKDIFDPNHPEKQYQAAYQMRYAQNDPEVVRILFSACYEAKDPKLQQEAVRSLGVLRPDRAFETFMKSTHSQDTEKRRRAYYHLGTLGNPKGIDAVLRGLSDPDETVRRAAAISAGRLGRDHRVIDALMKLVGGFEPESVKSMARRSIDYIQTPVNGSRSFNGERSFNQPAYKPKAYTPKGF